jgi:hypothetical protein
MSENPTIEEQWDMLVEHMLLAPVVAFDMLNASLAGFFDNDAFVERLKAKFVKGAKEHNGEWLSMEPNELILEANDEILDLWVYILMFAYRANEEANKNNPAATAE